MIRVILTHDQTADIIRQAGGESHHGRVFAVVSPGSYPTAPGRLVLHLIECPSMQAAAFAVEVARGRATARRIKPAKQASDAQEATAGQPEASDGATSQSETRTN